MIDITQITKGINGFITKGFDGASGKIRSLSVAIVFCVLFLHYWNILSCFSFEMPPIWGTDIRTFIHKNTIRIIIFNLGYEFILCEIIINMLARIDKKKFFDPFPVWLTTHSVILSLFSFYYLMVSLNMLVEFCNSVHTSDEKLYSEIALIYFLKTVIQRLYYKRKSEWENIYTETTHFFDCEGKRILKDSHVTYYGKEYKVYRSDIMSSEGTKNSWVISPLYERDDIIPLGEAVEDIDGRIKVISPYE